MTTGERIRSARQQKGFTQRELAEKSVLHLQALVNGKTMFETQNCHHC